MKITIEGPNTLTKQKALDAGALFTNGDERSTCVFMKTLHGAALVRGTGVGGEPDYFPDDEHGEDPALVVGYINVQL